MQKSGRLELTWAGKYDKQKPLEPRILLERPELSYGEQDNGNMLIHGDNLIALRALEQDFAGKVKCIYIDPPYNTGSAFEHYEDGMEHSEWLCMMKPRLELLRQLLSDDGFFCCHIDDSEGHYLKVILDEIYGRENYLTTLYVRVRYPDKTLKSDMDFHKEIEQIHVYQKGHNAKPNLNQEVIGYDKFCYSIETKVPYQEIKLGGKRVEIFEKGQYEIIQGEGTECGLKEIWASGTILDGNSSGRFFRDYLTGRYSIDGYSVLYKVYGIGDDRYDYRFFTGPQREGATKGKYYQGVPTSKLNTDEIVRKVPINGFYDLAGNFGNCRSEGGVDFRSGKKPEALLEMILRFFSNPHDIVLDSFLGSGSTVATAHKMGRRWIGVELGDHAYTHCKTRLDNVVDGEQSGISKTVGWQGGGGYRFYELAPSLFEKHPLLPIYQINKEYTFEMLCEAICKMEGFTYKPEGEMHGSSSENSFIHIAREFVSGDYTTKLMKEIGDNQSVLIYAARLQSGLRLPDNVEVKKIPKDLIKKYKFESEV